MKSKTRTRITRIARTNTDFLFFFIREIRKIRVPKIFANETPR